MLNNQALLEQQDNHFPGQLDEEDLSDNNLSTIDDELDRQEIDYEV